MVSDEGGRERMGLAGSAEMTGSVAGSIGHRRRPIMPTAMAFQPASPEPSERERRSRGLTRAGRPSGTSMSFPIRVRVAFLVNDRHPPEGRTPLAVHEAQLRARLPLPRPAQCPPWLASASICNASRPADNFSRIPALHCTETAMRGCFPPFFFFSFSLSSLPELLALKRSDGERIESKEDRPLDLSGR